MKTVAACNVIAPQLVAGAISFTVDQGSVAIEAVNAHLLGLEDNLTASGESLR